MIMFAKNYYELFYFKILGLGSGPRPKPKPKTQRDTGSEFNSIMFCIEINKCLKFLGLKTDDKFETS